MFLLNSISLSKTTQSLLRGLLLMIACVNATFSQAQPQRSTHEGWYQVEMVVFARTKDASGERWPTNIKLRYPNNWVELKSAPPLSNDTAEPVEAGSVPLAADNLIKDAFIHLPQTARNLNGQAAKLGRDSRFKVLFHQAWRQPITDKNSAKGILITGGEKVGEHYQLEGSITLSVATYLKLQTNLWLAQFDANVSEEVGTKWPEIPLPPNHADISSTRVFNEETRQTLDVENQRWSNSTLVTEDARRNYFTQQIILLEQERDMRSNEIHYIDHPVIGVIIHIIPYQPET